MGPAKTCPCGPTIAEPPDDDGSSRNLLASPVTPSSSMRALGVIPQELTTKHLAVYATFRLTIRLTEGKEEAVGLNGLK